VLAPHGGRREEDGRPEGHGGPIENRHLAFQGLAGEKFSIRPDGVGFLTGV
jgi:hypothetical protein